MNTERNGWLGHGTVNPEANGEKLFDLRAEYAEMAVQLGRMAESHDCLLALSIDPYIPRFFLGNPRLFRELLFALVRNSLVSPGVDIVNVQFHSLGVGVNGRHHMEISVTANGIGCPVEEMADLDHPRNPGANELPHFPCSAHTAMSTIAKMIQRLDGKLRVDHLHGWGTRYVAHLQLITATSH
ncbi:MAG: hypothetical protein OEV91_01935 [Desulfobulbaceae bacterium]|nr:hypothetical protein [Desulfobulbaceae bacterium]